MLDIKAFAQKHRIPLLSSGHHHTSKGWINTHCPFCSGGNRGWHLGFSLSKGNFACWRCGGLRFWEVIGALLRIRDKDQLKTIVSEFQTGSEKTPHEKIVREKEIEAPPCMQALHPAHIKYLNGRGFNVEHLKNKYNIKGTAGYSGVWNWRIIYPVWNGDDKIVAYQGRTIGDCKPKYKLSDDKNCLEDPRGLLYGIHDVEGDSVIIVEGATDRWRMGSGTVATLGIKWSDKQANKLRRFKNRYVMYDSGPGEEETGSQEKAREVAEHLSQFPGNTEVLSGFDCDPGDLTYPEVRRIKVKLNIK